MQFFKPTIHILDENLWFPPCGTAMSDGLLAIGGDMSLERLLLAYRKGIFPCFEGELPIWWAPDPRFVLFPQALKISKSMRSVLKKNTFEFTINKNFNGVIRSCQQMLRPDQDSTWITEEVVTGYTAVYKAGYGLSAEAWLDGELAGGLYGVWLGNVFFGESMFSRKSNASKFALIRLVEILEAAGVKIIDCQVYTEHLESLGARMISRDDFMEMLAAEVDVPASELKKQILSGARAGSGD